MKKAIPAVAILTAGILALTGCSPAEEVNEASVAWQKEAQLGEFAPDSQDWGAIEAAAREEGAVTVYSVSSRMQEFGEYFEAKYGIPVTFAELASDDQTERFAREYKADIHDTDVLYNNDAATMVLQFIPRGMVHNFVPDDVRELIAPEEAEPILNQRWTGRVLIYNSFANPDAAPIDSLWDLTRPEWKAKFQMPDPATDGAQADTIMSILAHPDEMAAAYEAEFGEPLTEYSKEVIDATAANKAYTEPDAAVEWLHQLLQNEPVFVESTTDISEAVGNVADANGPVGVTTYSKIRKTEPGAVEWLPAFDLNPTMGVFYPNVLAIADQAPHPNAAKLVIREMMLADGFAPWNETGDYATNVEIQAAQIAEFGDVMPPFDELNKYVVDFEYQQTHKKGFLQLYLAL